MLTGADFARAGLGSAGGAPDADGGSLFTGSIPGTSVNFGLSSAPGGVILNGILDGAAAFGGAGGAGGGVGTGGPLEAGTLSEAGAPAPFGGSLKGILAGDD